METDFDKLAAQFTKVIELERFADQLRMLAIEYQDKAITQERYAARVYFLTKEFFNQPEDKP